MDGKISNMKELKGQIERVTFASEESGFTIAKVKVYGEKNLVTVVGNLISAHAGSILKMQGEWINHPKFGEQFKVINFETEEPSTVFGIRKYLGSGMIKGVGPGMAKRIVKHFGEDTLDIIENNVSRLTEIEGIGTKRIDMIKSAWGDHKEIRSVMVFLQSHGVGTGYATKIFKTYGNKSIEIVKNNPYKLATDIFGIGFVTADKIAQKLGFEKSSHFRAEAGILYILNNCSDEGHVYFPYEDLVKKTTEQLDITDHIIIRAITSLSKEDKIVIEDNERVFLSKYQFCERKIAEKLSYLNNKKNKIRVIEPDKAVNWVQKELSIELAEKQIEAVKNAIVSKLMVITGGPGTGKTTIINSILKIYKKIGVEINLAAPTGRAAKRMSETTGHIAKTIHRLLEYSFKDGFKQNSENQLKCDLIIIDEASMLDTLLMHHLLKAVPEKATLILVGDVNQLPSVGAGNVLNDIIDSNQIPVVKLNEIFRQAQESQIIINAHRINTGKIPYTHNLENSDFYYIEKEDPNDVLNTIVRLVKDRIPKKFGFHPIEDIQVLTPMHRGVIGSGNLNEQLQEQLNPGGKEIVRGNIKFRVGDKVMQTRNNYDKDVYNGDIGRIHTVFDDKKVNIEFEKRVVTYEYNELDEVVLAYAVSVHKSQGSEYPVVVFPVMVQHYMLLQRNLIYTGVTRGKQLVVIVGTRKALTIGINNNKTEKRNTWLKTRMIASGNEDPFPDHFEH